MPVQYPTLSTPEITERVSILSKNTLFPYSYEIIGAMGAANFTGNYTPLSGNYLTIQFVADDLMSISALDVNFTVAFVNNTTKYYGYWAMELSYSPVPLFNVLSISGAPPTLPTPISDRGNIIYRSWNSLQVTAGAAGAGNSVTTTLSIDDFRRYEPYNYLLKFNQSIYIHLITDANTTGLGLGQFYGTFLFHMLTTGQKA